MDRISEKVPAGALAGAFFLAVGLTLPHSAPRASTPLDAPGLVAPGLGCAPADTPVGAAGAGQLSRIRADAAAGAPLDRRGAAEARPTLRPGPRKAARPSTPARLSAPRKAPRAGPEARQNVLRSFYTCNAAAMPNPAEGTGWRLVGPLRQG